LGEVRLESLVVVAKSPGRRDSISKYPHPLPLFLANYSI
jgi:hypothetical protein